VGCPMEGCGEWVTDLQGHCVQAHIPEVFQDLGHTGEDIGLTAGGSPELPNP
jgi:hypothetical protein